MSKATINACIIRSKDPTSTACWYQLYFGDDPGTAPLRGPFRDKTDAENAAEDEARSQGHKIEWWRD